MEKDFNGWTNRETWAVALHLTNTETAQQWLIALAKSTRDNPGDRAPRFLFSDRLRDAVEAAFDAVLHPTHPDTGYPMVDPEPCHNIGMSVQDTFAMVSDTGSLWRVNWDEIARQVFEDLD